MHVYVILASLAGSVTVISALFLFIRGLRRLFKKADNFFEDWYGLPERDGVPARKGVMLRLSDQDVQLSRLTAEISLDHGESMKDLTLANTRELKLVKKDLEHIKEAVTGGNQNASSD